jgi:shikimate 5-dehydrogenase
VISGETRLVGLLGDPVAGSLSPLMQNAAFAARGLDWAYVPLPVKGERLEDAIRGLVALGFAGANVTTPHKLAVARLVETEAPSVNTLVVRDGTVRGGRRVTPGGAVRQKVIRKERDPCRKMGKVVYPPEPRCRLREAKRRTLS